METVELRNYNGHKIACVFNDAGSKKIVVFCHGYRSSSIGPNRFFVRAARMLAERGISSLRFDQYGSGNSEGDYVDSSFNDWVATAKAIVQDYLKQGYEVALFGQSMGGSTVIAVASDMPEVSAVVSWVPDAHIQPVDMDPDEIVEESGQIVKARYWLEVADMHIADRLERVSAPAYIVQCSDDEFVSAENHEAIKNHARPNHTVEMYSGYRHSSWSYDQATDIIEKSVKFLEKDLTS